MDQHDTATGTDRATVPVSVVIPTIGRPGLLEGTLRSLAACDPLPAEIVLADQSEAGGAARAIAATGVDARVVEMPRLGISAGVNAGMRAATHDWVMVTNDDCRVAPDWVGRGHACLTSDPAAVWTGRVLAGAQPGRDPSAVPSVIDEPDEHTYEHVFEAYVLYAANMAVSARGAFDIGGFDERFTTASEDNDFCLRWLLSGRRLHYTPRLTIWHEDWRSEDELRALYRRYQLGQGVLIAKYLRLAPRVGLKLLKDEGVTVLHGTKNRVRHRGTGYVDPSYAAITHIPLGMARSWRAMSPAAGPGLVEP